MLDVLKGRSVDEALSPSCATCRSRSHARSRRSLRSAAANAENNFQLSTDDLRVKTAYADEGTRLHRFRAGARGRAKPYTQRYSHITIVVEDRG